MQMATVRVTWIGITEQLDGGMGWRICYFQSWQAVLGLALEQEEGAKVSEAERARGRRGGQGHEGRGRARGARSLQGRGASRVQSAECRVQSPEGARRTTSQLPAPSSRRPALHCHLPASPISRCQPEFLMNGTTIVTVLSTSNHLVF